MTGRLEITYPAWKRNLFRYFVSVPIIILSLATVLGSMLAIFCFQDWINDQAAKGKVPGVAKFVPKIMLAVSIGVLDDIYKKVAFWLNDKGRF